MINLSELDKAKLNKLRTAIGYLFSFDDAMNDKFICDILTKQMVEESFIAKSDKYNPILHLNESWEMIEKRGERYQHIQRSYHLLQSYFKISEKPFYKSSPILCLVKKLFNSFTSVLATLSAKEKKVVMPDFRKKPENNETSDLLNDAQLGKHYLN